LTKIGEWWIFNWQAIFDSEIVQTGSVNLGGLAACIYGKRLTAVSGAYCEGVLMAC